MKIVCSKENLVEGINIAQKAVASKTTLPVLEGILLEGGDQLKLTGNDLEIGIECFVEADIRQKGSVVLNCKMFGDIIRRMPEAEILIEVKENNLVIIECENSYFELKGLSSSGFPAIPEIKKDNTFKISQKILREMIRQTIFSVSIDENRPILKGSLLECKGGDINLVSIDGFRMAVRKNEIEGIVREFSVVIPGKTLNEIAKILQPVDEEVVIYNSHNQILFDLGACKVVSRLLEGEYLNYRSIIPKEFETKALVSTKDILSSLERASLITMDERRYPVKFLIGENKIIITSNTELGAVREEVKVSTEGGSLDIGFNPRYFIDALKVIEDEKIEIYFTSNIGPCTIKPVDGKEKYAYMILPIRTQ